MRGRIRTHGTSRVSTECHLAPRHLKRIEDLQATREGRADTKDQFDRLHGLGGSDDPGKRAEHAALRAVRDKTWRWGLPEEAAIARTSLGGEHGDLPLPAEDRPVHVRRPQQHTRIVDQISCREVVGTVDHHVISVEDTQRILGGEALVVTHHRDMRIHVPQPIFGTVQLAPADIGGAVQ